MGSADDTRFEWLARNFCRRLENGEGSLEQLYLWLVELVHAALLLSDLQVDDDDDQEIEPANIEADQLKIAATLRSWLPVNHYWMVFEPVADSPDELLPPGDDRLVMGMLFDDVLDIYRDLRTGLALADRGDLQQAIWEWRFGFLIHWGQHATAALVPLHQLLRDQGLHPGGST